MEDFACNDFVCASLDVIGSLSTAVGMVVGNIPQTKSLTYITGSVTVCCLGITVKIMVHFGDARQQYRAELKNL